MTTLSKVPPSTVVAVVSGVLAGITFVSTSSVIHGTALVVTQAIVSGLNVTLTSLGVHIIGRKTTTSKPAVVP